MIEKGYQECYIAFLDLLGFKNLVSNNKLDEILEIYKAIQNDNIDYLVLNNEELTERDAVKMKIMSDSICVYVNKNCKNAFLSIVAWCVYFQAKLLECSQPIFLRGAITLGNIYAKDDITFGTGVINAYLMEEKVAKNPRIIFSRQIVSEALINIDINAQIALKRIIFEDKDKLWSVNYLGFIKDLGKFTLLSNLKDFVEDKLASNSMEYFDTSIRDKYLYVLDHINK